MIIRGAVSLVGIVWITSCDNKLFHDVVNAHVVTLIFVVSVVGLPTYP